MALHVLIVEDDRCLRESVADYFGSKGWHTAGASNGEERRKK